MFSGGSEWMIILLLAVLLFGGSQIPKLAKSLGRAKKDFQDGLKDGELEAESAKKSDSESGAGKA